MKKIRSLFFVLLASLAMFPSVATAASLVTVDTAAMTDTITSVGTAAISVVVFYIAYPFVISFLKRIFGRAS